MTITVAPAITPDDRALCLEIRRIVFIDEQSVSLAEELDGLDDAADHVLARFDGAPAGTARLRFDAAHGIAKGERLAVLREYRRHKLGVAIMGALEGLARDRGARALTGAAQVQAMPFYERLGYVAEGPEFLDANIVHRAIVKAL